MAFDAHEEKVMSLLNRKVYSVPRNQRCYVWNKDNWQELFDDVMEVVNGRIQSHFIGSVVLKTDPTINGVPHYSVIDGQQRIITLTIFLASIMFWMRKFEMIDDFKGTIPYVVAKDDKNRDIIMVTAENYGSLESIINAIINEPDILNKRITVNSLVESNLVNKSDKNIADAFRFFMNTISDRYEYANKDKQILIKLRNAVRDITFVNITATSEEDSYTIFEILNARGLDLEDHELLKNYIMRYIQPDGERDKAKAQWNELELMVGHSNLNKFVRHYTTHMYGDYRSRSETSDYKIIQSSNRGRNTWELLMDLEKKAKYYLKLLLPTKTGDNANCSEHEYRVYSFFRKKRQEQMRPILLSLITKNKEGVISDRLYNETIDFLYNFYVCYNIIGEESSNRLTDTVNKFAAKINRDNTEDSVIKFVDELRKKLPSKEQFTNAFKNIGWSHHMGVYEGDKNKTRVQTVLEILERHMNLGICNDDFTIEHIKPDCEDPSNGQIGNLIPLEEALNRRCIEKDFSGKLDIYKDSNYKTARSFASRYGNMPFIPENRTNYLAGLFYDEILKIDFDK